MKHLRLGLAIVIGSTLVALVLDPAFAAEQNRITGITPACASPGDAVTITGFGFGALNAVVTVGDVPAQIVEATGSRVTFVVPADASWGHTSVRITHKRGNQAGSIDFRVGCAPAEGVLLDGPPQTPATDAVVDMRGTGAPGGQIEGGVILTRLDVDLAPGATVSQVNLALQRAQGGIVTMLHRFPSFVIAIPRQSGVSALRALAHSLTQLPGVNHVSLARPVTPDVLPPNNGGDPSPVHAKLHHLLPTRFPAAWNAKRLATRACGTSPVTVLVPDYFAAVPVDFYTHFEAQVPHLPIDGLSSDVSITHGYDVVATMAANFDGANPTGANPFPECLDLSGIQAGGFLAAEQLAINIVLSFPASGKFIMNTSLNFGSYCDGGICAPDAVDSEYVLDLAYAAAKWKALTHTRWSDFLLASSAGNVRDEPAAAIYPGAGYSSFNSERNAATLSDPLDFFVERHDLWDPVAALSQQGFPSLAVTDPDQLADLHTFIQLLGLDLLGAEDNILIVGSTTSGLNLNDQAEFQFLEESAFSNSDPDVKAVGEAIFNLDGSLSQGTSAAAPQVAGLASYLWLLSPDLRNNQPSQVTKRAIVDNARNNFATTGIIDALATVLSLDQAVEPTPATAPVRLAMLDVTDDEIPKFDENDLQLFEDNFPADGVTPKWDFSRGDLNGDGFTGGELKSERFDLDRVGSTQYGTTIYSDQILKSIEGNAVAFNENSLTDQEIVCYYAYSDMYTGDPVRRSELLLGKCAPFTISVQPGAVTLAPGGTQQFAAEVRGVLDPRVTWSLPAGGGTITSTGLFTAGTTAGTFRVRATSVAVVSKFAEATVTVGGTGQITILSTNGNCGATVQFWAGAPFLIKFSPPSSVSNVTSYHASVAVAGAGEETGSSYFDGITAASSAHQDTELGVTGNTLSFTSSAGGAGAASAPASPPGGLAFGGSGTNFSLRFAVTQPSRLSVSGSIGVGGHAGSGDNGTFRLDGTTFFVSSDPPRPPQSDIAIDAIIQPGDHQLQVDASVTANAVRGDPSRSNETEEFMWSISMTVGPVSGSAAKAEVVGSGSSHPDVARVGESGMKPGSQVAQAPARNQVCFTRPATAQVSFDLAESGRGNASLFDVTGRVVRRLGDGPWQRGMQRVDLETSSLSAGIYFFRLDLGSQRVVRRLVIL